MSVVLGKRDVGNPLTIASALKEVARFAEYPELFAILSVDGLVVSEDYAFAVARQARRALLDHRQHLSQSARDVLSRIAGET